ncbi:MAG TPA: CoA-transferase [Nocardioidaceae bacterium]|nr:CoA-transferase [Nocardioidaceae bacterium]
MDKLMTADDVVAELTDGMTIGIGGWGSRRKPMTLVRAILRSRLRDLTLVTYGGPDVGLLCAAGRVRKVVYGFVSLDSIPLEPHFRAAREQATVDVLELDEGMLQAGLRAAAHRLPFLPIRAGLGSAVLETPGGKELRTVRSPYDDAEELVAMPALHLDAALVHLNRADGQGNGQYLGPDPYFDDLYCLAARRRFLSCERVVGTAELTAESAPQSLLLNRMMVDGVVEAPGGAHFTSCIPDYGRDEPFQRAYAEAAADADGWRAFEERFLRGDETHYQEAVRSFHDAGAVDEHTPGAAR